MQKTLIAVMVALSVLLGIGCLMQARQINALRRANAAAEQARAAEAAAQQDQSLRIKSLERANAQLEKQVEKFADVTRSLRASEAQSSSNVTAWAQQLRSSGLKPGASAGENAQEGGGLFGKDMGKALGRMMKDPAMKEMMREQQKSVINMMYAGLFRDMKLTQQEKDRLKELLGGVQMKSVEMAQGMLGGAEGADPAESTKQLAEAKRQADEEIKTLLGEQRFTEFQDYQKTMTERMQLDQFKAQLAEETAPLRDDQMKQLLQAMSEEKTALPPAIPSDQTQMPTKETFNPENLDRQMTWMEEYNRRVLERAGKILNPDQLKSYEAFQAQQASMQKLGLNMARQMFGGEKAAPAAK